MLTRRWKALSNNPLTTLTGTHAAFAQTFRIRKGIQDTGHCNHNLRPLRLTALRLELQGMVGRRVTAHADLRLLVCKNASTCPSPLLLTLDGAELLMRFCFASAHKMVCHNIKAVGGANAAIIH